MKNLFENFPFQIRIFVSLFLCALFLNCDPGYADVLWIKGQNSPIYGEILRQSDDQIRFRVVDEMGNHADLLNLKPETVTQFVINIDKKRLAELSPSKPTDYRDFAEELAAQSSDPAAGKLARRLYLIAAFHSQQQFKQGCLKALLRLAKNEDERRQIQLLLSMQQPGEASFVEAPSAIVNTKPNDLSADELDLLLKLARHLRRDEQSEASLIANSGAGQAALKKWPVANQQRFLVRAIEAGKLEGLSLAKVISIEISILNLQGGQQETPIKSKSSWGELALQKPATNALVPSLENLTEFNPNESIYRNGKWTQP